MSLEIPIEVSEAINAKIQPCFGCGVCIGGCPVTRVNDRFHPRRLVRELVMSNWDDILQGEIIWLCTQCHICSETCPQGVGISDLIVNLRNLATDLSIQPPESYAKNAKQIAETGRMVSTSSRVERLRLRLNLNRMEPIPVEEIKKLIQDTKFDRLIADVGGS